MSIRELTKYDTNVNLNLEFGSQAAPGLIQAQAMKKSDLTTSTDDSMTSTLKKPAPQEKICGICKNPQKPTTPWYRNPQDSTTQRCKSCYDRAAAKVKKKCGICHEKKILPYNSPLDKTIKICRSCYGKAAASICGICGETKFLKCKSPQDKTIRCCNACYQKVYRKSKQNLKAASHKDVDCNEITSSTQHKKNSQDQTTKLYKQRYQKVTGTKSADTLIQATSLSCKRKSDRPTDLSPKKSLKPSPPCEQFPLARISHPLSRAIAAPLAEIAPQIDKDSVLVIRPCLSEGQGWGTQCASAPPREYEKCGLTPVQDGDALPGFNLLSSIPFTPSALGLLMQYFSIPSRDDLPIPLTPLLTPLAPLHLFPTAPLDLGLAEPPGLSYSDPASTPQGTSSVTNPPSSSTSFDPDTLFN